MLGYLLGRVLPEELKADTNEVIVITDTIPVNRKRKAVEKGIQLALNKKCSPQHFKCSLVVAAISKDCKIIIERDCAKDTKPLHECKGCSVNEREVLVRESFTNHPCNFKVYTGRLFNSCNTVSQSTPKYFCRIGRDKMMDETPSFNQYVITCDKRLVRR